VPAKGASFRVSHHDWHSRSYVDEWIARDVTRDDERRPRLREMIRAAPFAKSAPIAVLDVGGGYGVVSEEVLQAYPKAQVTLQDYSTPMLERARARLGPRVRYVESDLFDPAWVETAGGPFDLAVSAIAIHNLGDRTKIFACYRAIYGLLKDGGYFLNYDRFPGGLEPHVKALAAAGFTEAKPLWEAPPLAILVAGPR
jgi:ubiquinone/menaquinone biosynthesis C-methylase UbiE